MAKDLKQAKAIWRKGSTTSGRGGSLREMYDYGNDTDEECGKAKVHTKGQGRGPRITHEANQQTGCLRPCVSHPRLCKPDQIGIHTVQMLYFSNWHAIASPPSPWPFPWMVKQSSQSLLWAAKTLLFLGWEGLEGRRRMLRASLCAQDLLKVAVIQVLWGILWSSFFQNIIPKNLRYCWAMEVYSGHLLIQGMIHLSLIKKCQEHILVKDDLMRINSNRHSDNINDIRITMTML